MSKIKNTSELASSKLRADAIAIAEEGLVSIDTHGVIGSSVKIENNRLCVNDTICTLENVNRVFVVGIGKCSISAAEALEEILGDTLAGGIVCDVRDPGDSNLSVIEAYHGTHPFPSEANIKITKKIINLLNDLREDDLVLVIVSGGGSTLLCNPDEGMTCVNEQLILKKLFDAGATIHEINTIRKHISLARGGFLAKYAYPAQVIGLVFSDVPGNSMETIASGPTVKDSTTIKDADEILEKYKILETCNINHCGLIETPKEDKYFERVQNVLLVTNNKALNAMKHKAESLGYDAIIETDSLTGEARIQGKNIANALDNARENSVMLYAGETTVTVKGSGSGGRNQELALSALLRIGDDELVISLATDGIDNGEHAGGLVDADVRDKYIDIAEKFLDDNNSFEFFRKSGTAIKTGYTGSNVSDIIISIKGAQSKC